jgi:hypothetical protein
VSELGYVLLDRQTLQRAEERAQAEASSAVVSRAVVTGTRRTPEQQRFWDWVDGASQPPGAAVLAFRKGGS